MKETLNTVLVVIVFAFAFGAWLWVYRTAKKNTPLGQLLRVFWNFGYSLAAYIPFCGWMTRFIIADTEVEKREKRKAMQAADEMDSALLNAMEEKARKEKQEQEEFEQLNAQIQARFHANLVFLDRETNTAHLSNGKKLHINRK